MILTLKSFFSSAHFYFQPAWSPEKNREVFGRCFTQHGHGHNYTLEVDFKISSLSQTSLRYEYQQLLNDLTNPLDHEHLNYVIPEFKTKIPTTENIALYLLDKLKAVAGEAKIASIRVYEMDNLWTEIRL